MKTIWTFIGLFLAVTIGLVNGMCWQEHTQAQFCKADYVIRAKITSTVKFDIPKLPPTPKFPKPGNRGKGYGNGHNKTKKILNKLGPIPLRHVVPESRLPRSLAAPSGIGGGFPGNRWFRIPQYQTIVIKRILKGVGRVEKTDGATPQDKNTTKYTRYYGRVYIRNPGFRLKPGKAYLLAGMIINNKLWISFCDWHTQWTSLNIDQIRNLKKNFIQGCKCNIKTCFFNGCEDLNKDPGTCMWRPDSYRPGTDCKVKHSSCRAVKGKCQWKNSPRFSKCKKSKESESP